MEHNIILNINLLLNISTDCKGTEIGEILNTAYPYWLVVSKRNINDKIRWKISVEVRTISLVCTSKDTLINTVCQRPEGYGVLNKKKEEEEKKEMKKGKGKKLKKVFFNGIFFLKNAFKHVYRNDCPTSAKRHGHPVHVS